MAHEIIAQERSSGDVSSERLPIYDAETLHDRLEEFGWIDQAKWSESLVLTSSAPVSVDDVNLDVERELAFYGQALEAAQEAIRRFEGAGYAWRRPADFYADMVKSDDHMTRVKQQLVHEQKAISEMEQRRKEREAKKFAKAVQSEKLKEKARAKKNAIQQVTQLRKQRAQEGYKGDFDLDQALGNGPGDDAKKHNGRQGGPHNGPKKYVPPQKSKKRAARDAKFGFGGPKRRSKQNDAYSTADMDGRKGNRGFGGKAKGGAAKRPGKARRAAARK